jgi:hypothetical protein
MSDRGKGSQHWGSTLEDFLEEARADDGRGDYTRGRAADQ